ncbi:MAG: hypothetical protein K0V04_05725 [Deltaproteobacteria bacterium]|nr:hypothetical protein [Deltaproteobacteria bacterium]
MAPNDLFAPAFADVGGRRWTIARATSRLNWVNTVLEISEQLWMFYDPAVDGPAAYKFRLAVSDHRPVLLEW